MARRRTTINGGVLAVAALNDGGYPTSIGAASTAASNFILNAGTLRITGAQTNTNRSLTLGTGGGAFDIASSLQISGVIGGSVTLTGGGDFTLYVGYIRTDLKGNWSAFTGTIHAITDGDGGDFRITNTFDYPNASIDLGDQLFAYYIRNPPTGGLTIDIGALTGVATSNLKGGPTAGRTVTYRIGAKNTDFTFDGTITNSTGPTALLKNGTGTFTLTGACAVTVQTGGTLGGSGAIVGNVIINSGGTLSTGALAITGDLTNNGTVRLIGSAATVSGTFTNNGPPTRPAGLINNGTVLDSSVVKVKTVARDASNVVLMIQSYTGHHYQLQTKASLTTGVWTNVGAVQAGATGSVLTFTNPGATGGFYRIAVAP